MLSFANSSGWVFKGSSLAAGVCKGWTSQIAFLLCLVEPFYLLTAPIVFAFHEMIYFCVRYTLIEAPKLKTDQVDYRMIEPQNE